MAGEDLGYVRWIRGQRCAICRVPPPSEAHHASGDLCLVEIRTGEVTGSVCGRSLIHAATLLPVKS